MTHEFVLVESLVTEAHGETHASPSLYDTHPAFGLNHYGALSSIIGRETDVQRQVGEALHHFFENLI